MFLTYFVYKVHNFMVLLLYHKSLIVIWVGPKATIIALGTTLFDIIRPT